MKDDVRDERLGEVLDAAIRDLEPAAASRSSDVFRRGSRRRAARWTAIVAAIAIFVGGVGWASLLLREGRTSSGAGSWTSIGSLETTGWTLRAPSDWRMQDLSACPNAPERTGVVLTTADFEFLHPDGLEPGCQGRFVLAGFPTDGIALALEPVGDFGVFPTPPPETMFPLSLDRLRPSGGIRGGPRESALEITIHREMVLILRTWVGPNAPPSDVQRLAEIVGSLDVAGAIRWTTFRDEERGFEVTYPEDWLLADTNLTPVLSDPHEILSIGTYPLRPGGKACIDAYLPGDALQDLGARDVFITVQESSRGSGGPARPESFGPGAARLAVDGLPACDTYEPIPMRGWWFAFGDQGRSFYAFLSLGPEAAGDATIREAAWQVLDSLSFDPA